MNDTRVAKMCFKTLTSNAEQDNRRYNWSLNLWALLERTEFEHLWTHANQPYLVSNKQRMLDKSSNGILQKLNSGVATAMLLMSYSSKLSALSVTWMKLGFFTFSSLL
jgi:hypothetical protein